MRFCRASFLLRVPLLRGYSNERVSPRLRLRFIKLCARKAVSFKFEGDLFVFKLYCLVLIKNFGFAIIIKIKL